MNFHGQFPQASQEKKRFKRNERNEHREKALIQSLAMFPLGIRSQTGVSCEIWTENPEYFVER